MTIAVSDWLTCEADEHAPTLSNNRSRSLRFINILCMLCFFPLCAMSHRSMRHCKRTHYMHTPTHTHTHIQCTLCFSNLLLISQYSILLIIPVFALIIILIYFLITGQSKNLTEKHQITKWTTRCKDVTMADVIL